MSSSRRFRVLLGLLVLPIAGCHGGAAVRSSASTPGSQTRDGVVSYAVDESIAGFNVNTPADDEDVLQQVDNLVLPSLSTITPGDKMLVNRQLITSDKSKMIGGRQVVRLVINPKSVWADGTPITADDFIYNWQAQSGNPKYRDVGGQPFRVVGTEGYVRIASIKGSDPDSGTCLPGSSSQHNLGLCPNGDHVTITFAEPDQFWQQLFADMLPAHVARKVGWNEGFSNWKNLVSGSWYKIASYQPDRELVLVRNPGYWSTPARVSEFDIKFYPSDEAEVRALRAGAVDVISPTATDSAIARTVASTPGITSKTIPGLAYEHIDFNEDNPYLRLTAVRQAIAYATNRSQIMRQTVGKIDPTVQLLDNHLILNTQPGYAANGRGYDKPDDRKALSLLRGLGYRMVGGKTEPNSGPLKGQPLTFTINSTTGNPERLEIEKLFRQQLAKIGITIWIQNFPLSRLLDLPDYQISLFAYVEEGPTVTSGSPIYYGTSANGAEHNQLHYFNADVNRLLYEGNHSTTADGLNSSYNAADRILWADMVSLPLFQHPALFAWSNRIHGIQANGTSAWPHLECAALDAGVAPASCWCVCHRPATFAG